MTAAVAPGPPCSAHRAACLHGPDAATALDAGWQAACDETPGATVFQTSYWLRTWCDATAALEGVVPIVIRVPASGTLRLGVALQCRNGGDGIRIEPLSSPWADYHDAVGPGAGPDLDAAATALAALARDLGATLTFGDIRPEGLLAALCARLGGRWDPSTPVSQVNLLDGAHLARITERPEHVAKRRRLARKGGLALRRHRTCAAVLAALPRFITLHERQWHGRSDAVAPFSDPGVADSFTALAACLSRHGMLDLTELCHGDLVVASYYGFIYGRTYYAYRTAFDGNYFRFSPGHLMLQALVLSCAADGLAAFDLMRGEYVYKADYASVCGRNLAWTNVAGAGVTERQMPYVLPFFSFRPLGDGRIRLDHALTGQQAMVDEATLEALERLHHGETSDAALAGQMERMHILFPSREAAERWLDARDLSAIRAVPLVDQIELTNRCPYRCKMCPRTSSMTRGVGDMDLALFDRIIAQIAPNQDYVGLHHFGESLLHRDLVAAVARARSQGVKTGLSCNPPSLKPSLAQRLLDAGIADLVLSLDSLDPATYCSIRGPAARLDQALRHLEALVRLRDEGGHVTTITLQLIHMHENAAEADRFLSYCRNIGVDRGVVVRLGRWDFPDDKVEALGSFTSPLHGDYCNRPSQSVVVLWDGRVVPCCHDYDGAEVLGTLARQTLQDVWDSPAARVFRGKWDSTALCRQCAFGRTFREARRAIMGFRAFHQAPSPTPALEYVAERQGAPRHFNGFDVLHA